MTDTGIEPVDKITTRPLDQPKDKLGYDQETYFAKIYKFRTMQIFANYGHYLVLYKLLD